MTQNQLHELLDSDQAKALVEGAEERGHLEAAELEAFALEHELNGDEIEERRTREVLSGFRSRNGKPFRARLVLNDEDKIEFEFPVRAQTKEPAATE